MTVAELIDGLNKIEDKSLNVFYKDMGIFEHVEFIELQNAKPAGYEHPLDIVELI